MGWKRGAKMTLKCKWRQTHLSGTIGTLENVDRQASHQCREYLVKLFKVLQSVEHQSFLRLLPGLALVLPQLFTEKSQVSGLEHDLKEPRQSHKHHVFHCISLYRR